MKNLITPLPQHNTDRENSFFSLQCHIWQTSKHLREYPKYHTKTKFWEQIEKKDAQIVASQSFLRPNSHGISRQIYTSLLRSQTQELGEGMPIPVKTFAPPALMSTCR